MTSNAYSPWADLGRRPDLTLVWEKLPGRLGDYCHERRRIRLDPRMARRQARSVLAHELQHAIAGDRVTACERSNLRQEQAADQRAARLLIDVRDLASAMLTCDNHLSAMAVELRVSDAMLRVRREHLHPAERLYLRSMLEDVA